MRTLAVALIGIVVAGALPAATLDDAVINLKIRTELLDKFGTDALGVRIDVDGGKVVLSGAVDKNETQAGAKAAAATVKGVSSVENRITLGNGPATKTKDATRRAKRNWENSLLEARVKTRLFEQVGENALKITVKAAGGVVTLDGVLPTSHIRATALDTARSTKGVSRVVDRLKAG